MYEQVHWRSAMPVAGADHQIGTGIEGSGFKRWERSSKMNLVALAGGGRRGESFGDFG